MPNNPIPGDSLPAKRSKAPARGKMPSKAQAALLLDLDCKDSYIRHDHKSGDFHFIFTGGSRPIRFKTAFLVRWAGWVNRQTGLLTPVGREVLKQMEGE